MTEAMEKLKEDLCKMSFGMSRADALGSGICVQCREKALAKCYSDAGRREYWISGLCEECFDELFEK